MKRRALGAVGVDLAAVEAGALFRVGEQLERLADLLEALFSGLVARTRVGVQLLGELSLGAPDLLGRSRL